jgi:hypothetical protein
MHMRINGTRKVKLVDVCALPSLPILVLAVSIPELTVSKPELAVLVLFVSV